MGALQKKMLANGILNNQFVFRTIKIHTQKRKVITLTCLLSNILERN